jgi:hypothetical protein
MKFLEDALKVQLKEHGVWGLTVIAKYLIIRSTHHILPRLKLAESGIFAVPFVQ